MLTREITVLEITVSTTAANSEVIEFDKVAAAMVFVPAGSGITSLTWYAAPGPSGTFLPLYTTTSTTETAVVTAVQAGRCYPVPASVFAAGAVKCVGNTTGTVYVATKT